MLLQGEKMVDCVLGLDAVLIQVTTLVHHQFRVKPLKEYFLWFPMLLQLEHSFLSIVSHGITNPSLRQADVPYYYMLVLINA